MGEPILDYDEDWVSDNIDVEFVLKEGLFPFLNSSLLIFQSSQTERQIHKETVKQRNSERVILFFGNALLCQLWCSEVVVEITWIVKILSQKNRTSISIFASLFCTMALPN